jgi:dipeptidyl-peptidase-4
MTLPRRSHPHSRKAQLIGWIFCAACFAAADNASGADLNYERREVEGWTVHVREELLASDSAAATTRALELLQIQLREIARVVPATAVSRLKKVPLWISPEYPGIQPRAEYHPDAGWLRANDRNPAMAKGIEFTNVRIFEAETKRMPVFVLHELAHAYHDLVLGFDNPEIIAAFERAVKNKSYDAVKRRTTNGEPSHLERAYAMRDHKEYFAETSEAFFGQNDFFPFNRGDLHRHDPEMERLLEKLWQAPSDEQERENHD